MFHEAIAMTTDVSFSCEQEENSGRPEFRAGLKSGRVSCKARLNPIRETAALATSFFSNDAIHLLNNLRNNLLNLRDTSRLDKFYDDIDFPGDVNRWKLLHDVQILPANLLI